MNLLLSSNALVRGRPNMTAKAQPQPPRAWPELSWASGVRQVRANPRLLLQLLKAQLSLRGHGKLPPSVRLDGRVRIKGPGRIDFGNGVNLIANVVPIEILSHVGAQI